MKYRYNISFSGFVNEIRRDDGSLIDENMDDVRGIIYESFRPDLQAGVTIDMQDLHIRTEPVLHELESRVSKMEETVSTVKTAMQKERND